MYSDPFVFSVFGLCVGIMGFIYGLAAIKEIKDLQVRIVKMEETVKEVNRKLYYRE